MDKRDNKKYLRDWRAKNPGKASLYCKRWRAKNPLKVKEYRKNYALKHPEKLKEWKKKDRPKQIVRQRRRRLRNKLELVKWKGGKCEKCGYTKNLAALEFHNHSGDIVPSDLLGWSLTKAKKYLQESNLLCSNCHREIHHPELDINPSRRDNKPKEVKREWNSVSC